MSPSGPPDFEDVVLPHLDAGHNLARWLVRDPALAQDVVQDASVRALSYFATYRGGDARAWWLRIVRNAAYTAIAARQRAGADRLDDTRAHTLADPAPNPEAAANNSERTGRMNAALAALPAEWRECLVLRELETLSYKDIAGITGVPIGTVMSRLFRARKALDAAGLKETQP